MKYITLTIIFSICVLSTFGQSTNAQKEFGRKLFEHFTWYDFDFIIEQLAVRHNTIGFRKNLKETYESGQENNFVWSEIIVDDITVIKSTSGEYSGIQISFMWDAKPYHWQIHDIQYMQKKKQYKITTPAVSLIGDPLLLSK